MRRFWLLWVIWAVVASDVAAQTVALVWEPVPEVTPVSQPVTGYLLEWGTFPGLPTESRTLGPGVTRTEVTLAPGTYYFTVRTLIATMRSGPSNEVVVRVTEPLTLTVRVPPA